nr:uncharacterized protein LOC113810161 isoform X2 [Penaeus vannamei]
MADVAENNVDDEEVEDPLNSMIEEAIRNLQRNPNGSGGLAQTDQFSLIPAPPVSSAGSMESPSEIEFKGQRYGIGPRQLEHRRWLRHHLIHPYVHTRLYPPLPPPLAPSTE